MKSKWLVIILLGTAALSCALLFFAPKKALRAKIYLDGELIGVADLSEHREPYLIQAGAGNVAEVGHGRIRMLEADCPDGLCVSTGWSSSPAKPIVCLPNKVMILIESGADGPDAATG